MNDFFIKQETATLENAIRAVLSDTYLCDFGIVKETLGNGSIIVVEISSAKDSTDIRLITCVLAGLSTQEISIDIKPKEKDKVMVLYPRRYSTDMFDLSQDKAIISEDCLGYSAVKGIAFLMNQAKSDYKNTVTVENGELSLALAYDDNSKQNNLTLTANTKGEIVLTSSEVEFKTTDGFFSLKDKKGHKIVSDDNSVTINDHLKVK